MRTTTLWTAALLLGVGFSLALPAVSARNAPAESAAVPAQALAASKAPPTVAASSPAPAPAAAGQAPPGGGLAPPAAQAQGAAPEAAAPAAPGGGTAAPPAVQPPQPNSTAMPVDLDAAIDRLRQTLARQSGFETWRGASWTSYPLGPGLHGYVVLLTADGKEVGYMIITAAADGTFKLTEYGTGPRPLFSLATLYRSAVRQELIPSSVAFGEFLRDPAIRKERLYAGPLHALWKLTAGDKTSYLDAKTGEALPLSEKQLQPVIKPKPAASTASAASDAPAVAAKLQRPAFDPYERISWVTGKPLPLSAFADVSKALSGKQRLVYVAELYGGKVTVPLAVTGYHVWSGPAETYLSVDQDGPRYIRYAELEGAGRFFP